MTRIPSYKGPDFIYGHAVNNNMSLINNFDLNDLKSKKP